MGERATLALPDAALANYLAGVLPGFRGPLRATKFKGGQSNPTYLLEAASGRYVLRRKPPGQLLPRRTRWTASSACCRPCTAARCRWRSRCTCAATSR